MNGNEKQAHWYLPLRPHFSQIEDSMPLYNFAAVEAMLHLLDTVAPKADARKAYLLLSEYHLIGTEECSAEVHTLQNARFGLGYYRSQKAWQDALKLYCDLKYVAFRAFDIKQEEDGKIVVVPSEKPIPYSYDDRRREWQQFWEEPEQCRGEALWADSGRFQYFRAETDEEEDGLVTVLLSRCQDSHEIPTAMSKECREPIQISVEELLETARKMKEIQPKDYCYDVLKTNHLKKCLEGAVTEAGTLELRGVSNIVGMVGSGKSTLIKVLSYWCHCHDRKIVVVVDTVAEVLNLWSYLDSLHVSCSPLIGRGERMKYINQVAPPEQTCLKSELSQYLTPACLIDGLDDTHEKAVTYGREPCYQLKKGGKAHLCPWFDHCPGTKMLRECYSSSVVVTTVAGFAASRVGWTREMFLQLAMREFDLVIFDECDRVQKTLDQFFMPETKFNEYIKECSGECGRFMQQSSRQRESNPALQRYDEMQRQSVTVLSCIVKSLNREMGAWNKIAGQDPFSALVLLDDLRQKKTAYQIPEAVYQTLYSLIDPNREQTDNPWKQALRACCESIESDLFGELYQEGAQRLGDRFPRPKKERDRGIQDNRIQLILRLIHFDHFVEGLRSAYEACHETSYGQNELFGFLQSRFRQQQDLLPSSLCGNLFGLKKTDDEDILLFRQFAFGRSLMKDLPWLRTDADGRPAGPHVMLLSGSSWAEGSYEYHINRPVQYILESDREKREFLERTGFHESGFPERVSGAGSDDRDEMLRKITERSASVIAREAKQNTGKILLIVNSYSQAEVVQKTLKPALEAEGCQVGICRMISDAVNDGDQIGTIRRGEVGRFAGRSEKILIAPAMAIERGHNIVDETGHSALGSVFFMVRPMAVPDDIQQAVSKLNGYVEANCRRKVGESIFDYNLRVRQFATKRWQEISQSKAYGLNTLAAHEKRDVVATLFVLILQIFGRLARVTDPTKPAPEVYFMDGAFRKREDRQDDFDCLNELGEYLEGLMKKPRDAEIARTLYGPFYEAYKKGGLYHA